MFKADKRSQRKVKSANCSSLHFLSSDLSQLSLLLGVTHQSKDRDPVLPLFFTPLQDTAELFGKKEGTEMSQKKE